MSLFSLGSLVDFPLSLCSVHSPVIAAVWPQRPFKLRWYGVLPAGALLHISLIVVSSTKLALSTGPRYTASNRDRRNLEPEAFALRQQKAGALCAILVLRIIAHHLRALSQKRYPEPPPFREIHREPPKSLLKLPRVSTHPDSKPDVGYHALTYNENHTTSSNQPFVVTMALSERAAVNPEDLRGTDGTVRRALELWSCRNGPVPYNAWQSVFFELIRDHDAQDEGKEPGETQAAKQKRIRKLYNEIQEELHGPDHLAEALLQKRRGEVTGREVVVAQDQRMNPAMGEVQGRDTARDLPNAAEEFSMMTPRVSPRGDSMVPGENSPDRLLCLPQAEIAWEEDGATHTEATAECEERLVRLSTALGGVDGAEADGVEFVIRV